jgi:hypothetical protein
MATNILTTIIKAESSALRPRRSAAEQGRIMAGKIILPPMILPFIRSVAAWLLCWPFCRVSMLLATRPKTFQALFTCFTLFALLCFAPLAGHAEDYTWTTNNGTITITRYSGSSRDVSIPDTITGLPVTTIGPYAFESII